MLVYIDRDVVAGTRYGYRLGVNEGGREILLGETSVDVPSGPELSLAGFQSNPTRNDVRVVFSLADAAPAKLEMFDVSGRKIESIEVGNLGAGSHVLRIADGKPLPAGAYLLRLSRGARSLMARGVIVR